MPDAKREMCLTIDFSDHDVKQALAVYAVNQGIKDAMNWHTCKVTLSPESGTARLELYSVPAGPKAKSAT